MHGGPSFQICIRCKEQNVSVERGVLLCLPSCLRFFLLHASRRTSKRTETLPAENDETICVAGKSTSDHGTAPIYRVRKHQWQVDVRASFRVAGRHAPDRAWRVGGAYKYEGELGKGSLHRGEQNDMQKFSSVSHGSALPSCRKLKSAPRTSQPQPGAAGRCPPQPQPDRRVRVRLTVGFIKKPRCARKCR